MTGLANHWDEAYPFKTAPYDHQRAGLRQTAAAKEAALFMDTGTGKTFVILANAGMLWQRGEIDVLFVIAPNGLHVVWSDEAGKHLPEDRFIPHQVFTYSAGRTDKAIASLLNGIRKGTPRILHVVTMNVESLSSARGQRFAAAVADACKGRCLLAIDESHKIKTPSSIRTKAAWKLGEKVAYRRLATATPAGNGWQDLYAQFRFLDPKIIGVRSFTAFRAEYCIERTFSTFSTVVGYRNLEQLKAKIAPYVFRADKEKCLDIPKRIPPIRIPVELGPDQKKAYREMKQDFLTVLPHEAPRSEMDASVIAEQSMTRFLRMQQILSGFVPAADGTMHVFDENPRMDTLFELIENSGCKVLVWSRFQADVSRISARLAAQKIKGVEYYGNTGSDAREAAYRDFRTDPNIQVFNATGATGGAGLTLIEAPVSVYYSHTWDYIEREQTEGRNWRSGQTQAVTWYDLEVKGSMDTRILHRVTVEKRSISQSAMDYTDLRSMVESDEI